MRAEQRSRSLGQNDSMTQFPHAHYRHHTVNNLQRTRDHFGQLSPGPGPGATLTTPRVVFIFITTPSCRSHFCGLGPNTIKMLVRGEDDSISGYSHRKLCRCIVRGYRGSAQTTQDSWNTEQGEGDLKLFTT